jgi:hypothetical protein
MTSAVRHIDRQPDASSAPTSSTAPAVIRGCASSAALKSYLAAHIAGAATHATVPVGAPSISSARGGPELVGAGVALPGEHLAEPGRQAAKDLIIDLMHWLTQNGGLTADEVASLYAVYRSETLFPSGIGPEPSVTISECGIARGHYASRTEQQFAASARAID